MLWSNNFSIEESLSAEAWAKGYPDSKVNYKFVDYISNFEWFSTWLNNHFIFIIKKISVILSILVLIAIYINRNGKSLNSNIGFKIVLIFNLIFCLIWFLKFPVYRFGSGILISTIVITLVILLKNFNSDKFLRIINSYMG